MAFTASDSDYLEGEPDGMTFEAEAEVCGSCIAYVGITINDPNYYYLRGGAGAEYYISGETKVDLYGDIQ